MGRARTKAAQNYGTTLLGDKEIKQILDGRARQLEAELIGNRMSLAELEADPHITAATAEDHDAAVDGPVHPVVGVTRTIESLEARLAVLRDRIGELNPDDDEKS